MKNKRLAALGRGLVAAGTAALIGAVLSPPATAAGDGTQYYKVVPTCATASSGHAQCMTLQRIKVAKGAERPGVVQPAGPDRGGDPQEGEAGEEGDLRRVRLDRPLSRRHAGGFSWKVQRGSHTESGSGTSFSFKVKKPGKYAVTLSITDSYGFTGSTTVTVKVKAPHHHHKHHQGHHHKHRH